jgi:hypothetical protein
MKQDQTIDKIWWKTFEEKSIKKLCFMGGKSGT